MQVSFDKQLPPAARFDTPPGLRRREQGEMAKTAADRADWGRAPTPDEIPARVEGHVEQRLREAFEAQGVRLPERPRFEDFTPQAVAGRILGFVEQALGNLPESEERTNLLGQARQGIEKGFAEARDILEGMGVLQGRVADDIDETYDLVTQGLDRLENPQAAAAQASAVQAAAYSSSRVASGALSLQVTTADGDRVTLSLSREQGDARSAYAVSGEGFTGVAASSTSYRSASFSLSVEGTLDDDERKAIAALAKDVDKLSDRFFSGDTRAAFAAASRLGYDSEQLASFSLDLSHTVVRREVVAYQAVSRGGSAATADESAPLREAVSATADLRSLWRAVRDSGLFAQPEEALGDLFGGIGQIKGLLEQADEAMTRARELLDAFGRLERAGTGTPGPAEEPQGPREDKAPAEPQGPREEKVRAEPQGPREDKAQHEPQGEQKSHAPDKRK